jgi:outer membrane lipoprotein carrier protein
MSLNIFISFCSFFVLWFPVLLSAEVLPPPVGNDLLQVAERLQLQYDKTHSMSAEFRQVTSSRMSRRVIEGRGTLILLKPGRMRWDYTAPDKQVIVCDGVTIRMYFAREKQLLVSQAKQYLESDVTYSFFAGTGNLLQDFVISAPLEEDLVLPNEQIVLRIVPKGNHPQIDYILLWTDSTYLINRLMIVDQMGSTTDITFDNIKINPIIPVAQFTFVPPEGTEIIKQ